MTFKITIETDTPGQELLALEQKHNAGQPAVEPGHAPVEPYADRTGYEPTDLQRALMEEHPEDFQFHNAGRPAAESGRGTERCIPMEWNPDPLNH